MINCVLQQVFHATKNEKLIYSFCLEGEGVLYNWYIT
jgi:hypothetical protein